MMQRRGFIASILAAAAAPAYVRAGSIMRVNPAIIGGQWLVTEIERNTFTMQQVMRESLEMLHKKCGFLGTIERDYSNWQDDGRGGMIAICKPNVVAFNPVKLAGTNYGGRI